MMAAVRHVPLLSRCPVCLCICLSASLSVCLILSLCAFILI